MPFHSYIKKETLKQIDLMVYEPCLMEGDASKEIVNIVFHL